MPTGHLTHQGQNRWRSLTIRLHCSVSVPLFKLASRQLLGTCKYIVRLVNNDMLINSSAVAEMGDSCQWPHYGHNPQYTWAKKRGSCCTPFAESCTAVYYNVAGAEVYTFVPSGVFIHPAVRPQYTVSKKRPTLDFLQSLHIRFDCNNFWQTLYVVFSERELTFTFAICCRPSVCLSVVCLSSVCLSSVTLVHPTQAVTLLGNISTAFATLHPLTSTENFTEIVPGEPLRRGS